MIPFDLLENISKPKVFSCFQGDQKGTLGRKGLIKCQWKIVSDTVVILRLRLADQDLVLIWIWLESPMKELNTRIHVNSIIVL